MIVLRLFGREVLAVGRQDDPDPGESDLTGGTFEIAERLPAAGPRRRGLFDQPTPTTAGRSAPGRGTPVRVRG